jgi:vacuolar iron transporter family protein
VTIALSYVAGGLVPLSSYLFIRQIASALFVSIGVRLAALFVFGFMKGRFTGTKPAVSGLQALAIGGLAAAAAIALTRLIG